MKQCKKCKQKAVCFNEFNNVTQCLACGWITYFIIRWLCYFDFTCKLFIIDFDKQ